MLAVMRYRQIPYSLIWGDPGPVLDEMGLARAQTVTAASCGDATLDGGDVARCDSTPIIRDLEAIYAGRSVLPDDPAISLPGLPDRRFSATSGAPSICFTIAGTRPESADNASTRLPLGHNICLESEEHQRAKEDFARASNRPLVRGWLE